MLTTSEITIKIIDIAYILYNFELLEAIVDYEDFRNKSHIRNSFQMDFKQSDKFIPQHSIIYFLYLIISIVIPFLVNPIFYFVPCCWLHYL